MRILLDCRPLQSAGPEAEKSRLIFAAAAGLAADGVEWMVVADRRYRPGLFPVLPGQVIIRRAWPGVVGWRFWYGRQIRRLLTRGVDMVWLTGGIAVPEIEVPVCLWMPEYRRRPVSGLGRAAVIICYSDRDRAWLSHSRPEVREKIQVIPAIPDDTISPLSIEEKETIKGEKAQGKEYFLADLTGCEADAVVDLLKAFTLFKKRQRSQMRLMLTGRIRAAGRIGEQLKSYKYREDVDWVIGAPDGEVRALTGAAYAVLLPVEGNSLGTTLLNTWRAGVPVISAGGGLLEEMAQGAVLNMIPGDPASLAGQLMRIYKEEDLREELIGKGFDRLKVYSRENFLRVLRVITEIAAC